MAATDAPTSALGSSGSPWTNSTFGWPVDVLEHVPDVMWPTSIRTFGRMRRDPVIASVLAAYSTPIIGADWRIDPRGADDRAVKLCADALGIPIVGQKVVDPGPVRRRGVKWADHIRLACLSLTFGHMPFEPVYEVRGDGLAYLMALPERMPSTLTEIKANDDGSLMSIVQEAPVGTGAKSNPMGVEIPANRLLFYAHDREGANWAGSSLIRPAYSMWLLKQEVVRANAVGIKRWSSGIPVAEPLPGTNPTPAQIAVAQQMVSGARGGETAGAVPVGFKLRIIGIEGTLPDAMPTLQYFDAQIARSTLTSILDLGNTATGSRALGDNFVDLLSRALQATGERMAETATQLCERMVDFNFGPDAPVPAVTCGDVAASKATVAESIVGLIQVGAIRPDAGLEAYIREGFDLPEAGTPYVPTPKPGAPTPPAPPIAPPPDAPPANTPPADAQVGTQVAAKAAPERAAGGDKGNQGNIRPIIEWFTHGAGAALVQWGSAGDFDRCTALAAKHMTPEQAKGFCNERHHDALGIYPATHAKLIRDGRKTVHAAAPDAAKTGIMVALMVPPEVASGLALDIPGAEPADELHLTLVYLGKTTDVTEAGYATRVLDVVREVAARHPVMNGKVSGSGRFTTPDGDAVYLSYDSPELPELRHDLFASLRDAGIEPVATHGFSPHITLAYVQSGTATPLDHVDTSDLAFPALTLAYGGQRFDFPLGNPDAPQVKAAADQPQYRAPTAQEQAAGIDPAAVDADQDALVAEGMTLFAAIVAVWGAAIAAQITASLAAGSLAGLARLSVNSIDAAQGLAVLMREAADAGIKHALAEAGRAGIPGPGIAPVVDEAALDDAAAAQAELMGQGFASAVGREAARLAGPGADPKAVAREAVATVTASDTPIHDAIQAGVTRALGAGRAAAQQALSLGADLVPFHAGIRDQVQCVACAEHDGTEYPDLAAAVQDFPTGHYVACLGRARCRCMIGLRPVKP